MAEECLLHLFQANTTGVKTKKQSGICSYDHKTFVYLFKVKKSLSLGQAEIFYLYFKKCLEASTSQYLAFALFFFSVECFPAR